MLKKSFLIVATIALTLSTLQAQPYSSTSTVSTPSVTQKPFLIQQGLPHYTMLLIHLWDDPQLALTPKQKRALKEVRQKTIRAIKTLKPKIIELRRAIITGSMKHINPKNLYEKVDTLAKLQAQATQVHLDCIYETEQILTPKQLAYLKSQRQ